MPTELASERTEVACAGAHRPDAHRSLPIPAVPIPSLPTTPLRDMARLDVEGDALVVRPAWWEKIAVRRSAVTVPLQAVTGASVQQDWWRALRGSPARGRSFSVPQYRCLGVWRHRDGQDFVAIAPRRGPVVQVDLRPSPRPRSAPPAAPSAAQQPPAVPFGRIAVTTPEAQNVVAAIRAALRRRAEAASRPAPSPPPPP